MMRLVFCLLVLVASTLTPVSAQNAAESLLQKAPESEWRRLDPENILVLDLPSGELLIEMRPDLAPQHVKRVKTLARRGFYDGLLFHRVIDGFMAQGGDPLGDGTGGSDLPDIPGEFMHAYKDYDLAYIGRGPMSPKIAFLGPVPIAAQPPEITEMIAMEDVALWGMHCPGVMSMARADAPNSANSQYFIMLADSRQSLDQRYTVWGRVVAGERNSRRINIGSPPERPTPMLRLRIMADLPLDEQTAIEVLNTRHETFKAWLRASQLMTDDGFIADVCAIRVPTRINGDIQ